jgi:hypothetical protein
MTDSWREGLDTKGSGRLFEEECGIEEEDNGKRVLPC